MLAGRQVYCSDREISVFDPPSGQTCGAYLQEYASAAGGTVQNPSATSSCEYCSLSNSNQFLASVSISYSDRWRNFGIIFAFILFNIFIAVLTYWAFRVANLKTLTAKFHKTKKGAKTKEAAEKTKDEASNVVAQGAHPGARSGEKDT
jgi:ATP-binding cassette subfamily G (WHITE) protein 2 (PDR)